ncbi:HTH domain-containing protein [Aeromicrobium sp.]|uniref:HTH domain-containing protein n=1 Tax=Aeromicrobium sp. TaxID=1871063 RepID=UPI00345AA5D8
MATSSSRLLTLLSLLGARPSWPGQELAERLGVSTRPLRRDTKGWESSATPSARSRAQTAATDSATTARRPRCCSTTSRPSPSPSPSRPLPAACLASTTRSPGL